MVLAVMGLLLGLLLLGHLTVVTYGKAENGDLVTTASTGKRVGARDYMATGESLFLLNR